MENFPWNSMEYHGIPWRFFTRVLPTMAAATVEELSEDSSGLLSG